MMQQPAGTFDFQALFEALPDAAFVFDQDTGQILAANSPAARLYGYSRAELLGLSAAELSTEPLETMKALHGTDFHAHRRVHRRKDGTTFVVEASVSPFTWEGRAALAVIGRDSTERQAMEDALRGSKALLSNAFHRSPLLMAISDLATDRYLEVNDAFCARIGFTREEMVGRTAVELGMIDAQERELLAQRLMSAPRNTAIELIISSKSGPRITCRYWGEVVNSSEGPKLLGAAEDVTEHRQVAQAREEALIRLEKIASRVPGVVYQYRLRPDGTSCFPFASEALRDIYRVSPEEVQHDAAVVFTRLHPEDSPGVVASIQQSARDLTPWQHEYRAKFEDGTVRWLLGSALPEKEADGAVLWHGFITDVTERRQADEALKKSDERFVLAMDATSDALWDWDLVTDGGYFSPGYFRMLGFDVGTFAATGKSWRDLIHPADRDAADRANLDCIEGRKERFEVEYRMRAHDGAWRWILGRGKCVARDAHGRALRLLGTHVDITERKKLEAGLAQADRMASMGMLAAGVAHEINNPLAYVLANLETLALDLPKLVELARWCATAIAEQQGQAALAGHDAGLLRPGALEELLEGARDALEGTRRIRKISQGLGTFARAERVELNHVDVNLALETAISMAHNEVKYRAQLIKQLGPVPPVLASDGKLAQVFLNLLINAAHAIDEGHVDRNRITVRTWSEGASVFVEIADTGHGIPAENLGRIFEPFFTTKKVGVGSGLGLSISKNIVTEFGGELRVESRVGEGTRLFVRLPACAATPVALPPPQPAKPAAPAVHGRVLVVDDEEPIRRILQRLLAEHEVLTAASGREARALLEKDQRFDVILCDLMMPEMTGMELHAWLVATLPVLARRVVFVSGGAFTPHASDYLASVSNVLLDKPIDPVRLRRLTSELVRAARTQSPAASA